MSEVEPALLRSSCHTTKTVPPGPTATDGFSWRLELLTTWTSAPNSIDAAGRGTSRRATTASAATAAIRVHFEPLLSMEIPSMPYKTVVGLYGFWCSPRIDI